jgi:hypothetical protein
MSRPSKVADYYAKASLSVRFYDALTARDRNLRGDVAFYAAGSGRLRSACSNSVAAPGA